MTPGTQDGLRQVNLQLWNWRGRDGRFLKALVLA